VERPREVARPLQCGRHGSGERCEAALPQSFVTYKEKCAISAIVQLRNPDRSAKRKSELIALKAWLSLSCAIGIESVCIQYTVPQKFVSRSMKLVRAGADGKADHAAAGSPELSRIRAGIHFEFL